MATQIWVNFGSVNGFLPDGAKLVPEPILTNHQMCFVAFIWKQFHKRCAQELHAEHVSNHRRLDCLLKYFFRRRLKKASNFRVTGLCDRYSPVTGEFPVKRPVTRKMFPFDNVIMDIQQRFIIRPTGNSSLEPECKWQNGWYQMHKIMFINYFV